MGYEYLVKVDKSDDLYVLADGRNSRILYVGSREFFDTNEFAKEAVERMNSNIDGAEPFDFADEFGATDQRMFWDDSTYIDEDDRAIPRSLLGLYISDGEQPDEGRFRPGEAHMAYSWSRAAEPTFGGLSKPDLMIAVERAQISPGDLTAFMGDLEGEFPRRDFGYTQLGGIAVLESAKKFADEGDTYSLLGWMAALSLMAGPDNELSRVSSNTSRSDRSGLFLAHFFDDLHGKHWRDIYAIANAVPQDENGLRVMKITSLLSLSDEVGMDKVLDYVLAGHSDASRIRKLIDEDIDPDLSAAVFPTTTFPTTGSRVSSGKCSYWMPRAERPCSLTALHKGPHR